MTHQGYSIKSIKQTNLFGIFDEKGEEVGNGRFTSLTYAMKAVEELRKKDQPKKEKANVK